MSTSPLKVAMAEHEIANLSDGADSYQRKVAKELEELHEKLEKLRRRDGSWAAVWCNLRTEDPEEYKQFLDLIERAAS